MACLFDSCALLPCSSGTAGHEPLILQRREFQLTHTVLPHDRVRENLLNTLTRKFIDEMKAYQAAQQKYKTDIQNKMKRQVKVVKPDATDEEVEEIMRSEGGRDALYKQTILAGGVNDEIT